MSSKVSGRTVEDKKQTSIDLFEEYVRKKVEDIFNNGMVIPAELDDEDKLRDFLEFSEEIPKGVKRNLENLLRLAQKLDQVAGKDYYIYIPDDDLVSLASRVQDVSGFQKNNNFSDFPPTFTITKDTVYDSKNEFPKKNNAINYKTEYPNFTIQAYVDKKQDQLVNAAMCRTEALFDHINNSKKGTAGPNKSRAVDGGYWVEKNNQGTEFIVVSWADLRYDGYKVYVLYDEGGQPIDSRKQSISEDIITGSLPFNIDNCC